MLAGKNITLLVGGSIAAYKSAELVRELVRRGSKVHVVMSQAATEFLSPLTLQTLSGNVVTTDLFDPVRESQINHIWLADHADLVLVAPASADIIARAAGGLADDAVTTVLLATRAPVIIAPAMNVNMWTNRLTQRNVKTLTELGMVFVDPDEGELACGWVGQGRFAEMSRVIYALESASSPKDLRGSHIVVSAGPTQEPIDPVRFVSNRSAGRMGYAIARVAQLRGAHVSLVSGPTQLPVPEGVDFYPVSTAREMRDRIFELTMKPEPRVVDPKSGRDTNPSQFVFMAAAVADHQPAVTSGVKIKHPANANYTLEMVPSPDILLELSERRAEIEEASQARLKLIGFAAEAGDAEELITWATEKLKKKNADLMVGDPVDISLGRDTNRVWLLDRGGRQEEITNADKDLIASRIIASAMRA